MEILEIKVLRAIKMNKECLKVLSPCLFVEYAYLNKKKTWRRILLLVPASVQVRWALCMSTVLECGLILKERPDLLILLIPINGQLSGVRCVTFPFLCTTNLIQKRVLSFSISKILLLIVITHILSLRLFTNKKK